MPAPFDRRPRARSPWRATALMLLVMVAASPARAAPAEPSRPESAPRPAVAALPTGPAPTAPLAGVSGDTAFLRSSNNLFVLFPGAHVQIDGRFFAQQTPKSGFLLRRARLELAGWIGPAVYFTLAGDLGAPPPAEANPAPPANLATADAYVALAPWGDAAILQIGQFDAPFTFENRTADRYIDFAERSLAVRALGAPANKEVGVMLHGTDDRQVIHYSGGVFNGDGANFRNVDNQFHLIGRAWIAPFALDRSSSLGRISVGGSIWSGRHLNGLALPTQTTAGGLPFLDARWSVGRGEATTPLELHQQGRMFAYAVELHAPFTHRFGLRAEYVFKHQQLAEDDVTASATGLLTTLRSVVLDGVAGYADVWWWLIGDDHVLPRAGLQLPRRLTGVVDGTAPYGLMLAVRGELLREDIRPAPPLKDNPNANPNQDTTRVMSLSAALNYWYSNRFRFSANYVLNVFGGSTENIKALSAAMAREHEVLLRFAIAL